MLGKRNVTTPILMTSWRHLKFWPYRFIFIGLQSLKQVFWFILVVPLSIYLIWFNYIYNNTTSFRMVGYIPLTSMVLPVFPTLEQSPTLPISHLGKKNRSFPNQKKPSFQPAKMSWKRHRFFLQKQVDAWQVTMLLTAKFFASKSFEPNASQRSTPGVFSAQGWDWLGLGSW